ncbi:MAG: LysM peptidoglycan-binding domain-containing protein, partial [Proteobacteria bacterium]|nr:LysM peptidoglycan-binding domain-containing protein [Pseudomonadota bacterium]
NPLASTNAAGNFDNDYNYTPVNERYPGASPGSYVVSSGDTLRAIALAVYGDARLWFLIAQANGLSSDADLRAGQTLNVPNRVTNLYASAQTVRPYSPGEIVGDTTPTLPDPPPPPPPPQGRGGCGGFGQVLVMVVSIAVAVAMPAAMGWTAGQLTLGQAMTIGAVSNVAGQVAGNIAGVQKGFNFRSLAVAVASAGIGNGINNLAGPGQSLAHKLLGPELAKGFAGAAFNAAAGSLLGQGAAILVGAQQRFDWRAVAAAAAGGRAQHRLPGGGQPRTGELRTGRRRCVREYAGQCPCSSVRQDRAARHPPARVAGPGLRAAIRRCEYVTGHRPAIGRDGHQRLCQRRATVRLGYGGLAP